MKQRLFYTIFSIALLALLAGCAPFQEHAYDPQVIGTTPDGKPILVDIVWQRLKWNFRLNHYTYKGPVREQIRWFQNHKKVLYRMLNNATPYMYYISSEVQKRGLPGELALLPIIESAYDPFAYSHSGASGLWQLMPRTARGYGMRQDWWYDGRRDIHASTQAALYHLSSLGRIFNGDWLLAVAAYNAGAGRVQSVMNAHHSHTFWSLPLPLETQTYVPRLLAMAAIIEHPSRYGITPPRITNTPYFAEISLNSPVDLPRAAQYAGISLQELYRLNPGYNRWKIGPTNSPCRLLLPVDRLEQFKTNLLSHPVQEKPEPYTSTGYRVKAGENLRVIAARFHTTPERLGALNQVSNAEVRPGLILQIPVQPPKKYKVKVLKLKRGVVYHPSKVKPNARPAKFYTVHKGETLYHISKEHGVSVDALKAANPGGTIKPGQILKIPH